jgi:hypothetical protein
VDSALLAYFTLVSLFWLALQVRLALKASGGGCCSIFDGMCVVVVFEDDMWVVCLV